MRGPAWCVAASGIVFVIGSTNGIVAQEHVALQSDLLFYGDNTEFRNPFREGETIFGAAVRIAAIAGINDRTSITLGVFTNQRFGADDAFELVRPVVALTVRQHRSLFVFGTLPSRSAAAQPGPDRAGPHALLPPLQRETLAFDRPFEAGLEWKYTGTRWQGDTWLNWQRVNTPAHRERLDAGISGELRIATSWYVPVQLHVVHQGGQLFGPGAVTDSVAAAIGAALRRKIRDTDIALETFLLASRDVPDRSRPERSRSGAAVFARGSVERGPWRGHLIMWRGDDFVKDEGDPNYQSVRRDGTRYRGVRDYAEAGATRSFKPAPAVRIEASARLHRVERFYEYSYRILGITSVRWRLH
jgi:hypothetical protein